MVPPEEAPEGPKHVVVTQ